MDIMGMLMGLVTAFVSNPQVQPVLMGLLIKFGTDVVKAFLVNVDKSGSAQKAQVPIHLVVLVASTVVTLCNLALQGKLSTFDVNSVMNFIVVALPSYLSALGFHQAAKAACVKVTGKEAPLQEALKAKK